MPPERSRSNNGAICAIFFRLHAFRSPAPSSVEVRDWKAIDTNGDHFISPEEMEKYLHEKPGPAQKKKG